MNRLLCCTFSLLGLAIFATPTQAQVYYSTYYAPTYAPVVAPSTVYYPSANRVTSYYAPTTTVLPGTAYTTTPVTTYMAPGTQVPVTSYYAPTPVTNYYAPTPVTSYYAPTATAVAPVYTTPVAVVRTSRYVPFQPVRNTFRAFAY